MIYQSRVVKIGNCLLGGNHPVRVQSMTNTDTQNIEATVAQCIKIFEAGGELVRLTVPGIQEVESLKKIIAELRQRNYNFPIIADVHYSAEVAEMCAHIADKVRINPGNYFDRKTGKRDFTDQDFIDGKAEIKRRIEPLIKICKQKNTAIRIGANHGSLSERIVFRYGNTAVGMVQSAMEFLEICAGFDFHNIVVSMKASDPRLTIESTRLLVKSMMENNMNYPVHLGVTEAGEGDDGRLISAVGIGTLLCEGIGNTIRVSLSEAPENEIPVALKIVDLCSKKIRDEKANHQSNFTKEITIGNIILPNPMVATWANEGYSENADLIIKNLPEKLFYSPKNSTYFEEGIHNSPEIFPLSNHQDLNKFYNLRKQTELPIIIDYRAQENRSDFSITEAAVDLAHIFIDRLAEGLIISGSDNGTQIAFDILQACKVRITKAEFISCPTCGRTCFDLSDIAKGVKKYAKNLLGLKIAVMGCDVNGPGEMADADYGCVGTRTGKVHIYKGQEIVKRNLNPSDVLTELINLIKAENKFIY